TVHATRVVHVLAGAAVVPELSDALGETGVSGSHRAAVAIGSEVFRWVEAPCSSGRESSASATAIAGTVRLSGILDDDDSVLGRDLVDGRHVRGLTVEMHRDHGACARGDRSFDCGWI